MAGEDEILFLELFLEPASPRTRTNVAELGHWGKAETGELYVIGCIARLHVCGWRGVLILLSLLKITDWVWSWEWWANFVVAAGVLLITALATVQELRIGEELDKVSPAVVAQTGWPNVQVEAARCRRRERLTLRELRGDVPEEEVGVIDSPRRASTGSGCTLRESSGGYPGIAPPVPAAHGTAPRGV